MLPSAELALELEVHAQLHGDGTRTVLHARGAPEVRVTHRPVHAEIGTVERIERVGGELQTNQVAVALGPHTELLVQRDVIHQDGRLTELAVVL